MGNKKKQSFSKKVSRNFTQKSMSSIVSSARSRDAVFQKDQGAYDSQRVSARSTSWFDLHSGRIAFVGIFILTEIILILLTSVLISVVSGNLLSEQVLRNPPFNHLYESMVNTQSVFMGSVMWLLLRGYVVHLISFVCAVIGAIAARNYSKKRMTELDTSEMKTDVNDSWIWNTEQMIEQYAIVPDRGAWSKDVSVTSIVGHAYLSAKGLKKVDYPRHDDKGNIQLDPETKEPIYDHVSIVDTGVVPGMLDSMGLVELDKNEVYLDARRYKYDYDPDSGKVRTLAQFINSDWFLPDFEILRPTGFYYVEDKSAHTLVISMTRGNKTQLVTFATIDTWRRDNLEWNMIVNDPKGGARRFLVKS